MVKCSEVLQCSDVLLAISFLSLCIWMYVLCTLVYFCKLCIFIVMFMYALLCLFCFQSGYPDRGFSVLFPPFVSQMPGYTSQRRGTVRTLHNQLIVLFWTVLFCVLFMCKCVLYCTVLYYCHRVWTQLQLNIYHIMPLFRKWLVNDNQQILK